MTRCNIKGQRFGRLVAIRGFYNGKGSRWLCRCDCGTRKIISLDHLRAGTISCGCYRREHPPARTHGMKGTKEYSAWISMRRRVVDPRRDSFRRYGGRGIKVCKRWQKFENFYADMGPAPTSRHSIDRKNNDGDYKPSNCRWATPRQQRHNRRDS